MLLAIALRDFVLIESLDLDFSAGLTTLTGETGAGKSIVLDAVGLLLGDRGDARFIRQGADKCDIALEYDISALPTVKTWLAEQDLQSDDDVLLLRRVIATNGRSRCYVNGTAQPVGHLKTLGEWLIDIHGQNDHQSLVRPARQLALLDECVQQPDLLAQVNDAYQQYQQAVDKVTQASQNQAQQQQRLDFLTFQVEELDQLALTEGELEALDAEQSTLSHSEQLISTAENALALLRDNDHAIDAQLSRLTQDCQQLAAIAPAMKEAAEMLDAATININEASETLSRFASNSELDPNRLHWVENRLSEIFRLAKKHHIDPSEVVTHHAQLSEELAELQSLNEDPEALQAAADAAKKQYDRVAEQLSTARKAAASELSQQVTDIMQTLSMEGGKLSIDLTPHEPSSLGSERCQFLVAANAGQAAGLLGTVASGGEMSRISLAIQVASVGAGSAPTLIFDEVDTGIGGKTAAIVGRRLRELANNQQILSVTHLPQVAASGHQHLLVSKSTTNQQTTTTVTTLSETDRIEELARMLGSESITTTTRANAQDILHQQTQ